MNDKENGHEETKNLYLFLSFFTPLSSIHPPIHPSIPSLRQITARQYPRQLREDQGILCFPRCGRAPSQPKTYLSPKFWENVTRELYVLRAEGGREVSEVREVREGYGYRWFAGLGIGRVRGMGGEGRRKGMERDEKGARKVA
ncbi:hypothetical protein E2C01_044770 [Portunus trituberculatus]|uniref:Uncharacterized protein n=1 Tax=Portunus trituberculatus TaxID=210409 RepID=A0A5B7FZ93_PORTR|nr:hypothetical protein [Portunus trituberculatus]